MMMMGREGGNSTELSYMTSLTLSRSRASAHGSHPPIRYCVIFYPSKPHHSHSAYVCDILYRLPAYGPPASKKNLVIPHHHDSPSHISFKPAVCRSWDSTCNQRQTNLIPTPKLHAQSTSNIYKLPPQSILHQILLPSCTCSFLRQGNLLPHAINPI